MKTTEYRSPPSHSSAPEYAEAVPAVVRAVEVIEHLQKASDPLSLTELSRALGISPSSLSAILRTLASRGFIARDDATVRYRLGPAFESLMAASTTRLAMRESADGIAALARASVIERDVGTSDHRQRETMRALGLAGRHLSDLLLAEAARELPTGANPETVWRAEAAGPLGLAELDRFLDGGLIATLSCVKEDGYPYSVPMWYQWEDRRFWVVPRARAEWAGHLERNPRVSLAISEQGPPLRRVLVEGKADQVAGPASQERARQLTELMAQRYLGASAGSYLAATASQKQRVFAIIPEKLVTWHGLASHPRYQIPRPQATDDTEVA